LKLNDLYQSITAGIIHDLENGSVPWVRPWKGTGLMPVNAFSGNPYHGINIPILWRAAQMRGFPTHEWMTFHQALEKKAAVRKGEKGTHIVFVKRLQFKREDDDGFDRRTMLRSFSVFNVAQIDGLPVKEPDPQLSDAERDAGAEAFIKATGASIGHGGDMAAYVPLTDSIVLPPFEAFNGPENYYATSLHELGHWTGAKHRLDRDLSGRFGSKSYAAEELVAELTAAFLCAHLGIQGELRHAAYIKTWIALLKEDPRAIFTASSKASQAADYLSAFSKPVVEAA
jgi:antirestriction protein ArdC